MTHQAAFKQVLVALIVSLLVVAQNSASMAQQPDGERPRLVDLIPLSIQFTPLIDGRFDIVFEYNSIFSDPSQPFAFDIVSVLQINNDIAFVFHDPGALVSIDGGPVGGACGDSSPSSCGGQCPTGFPDGRITTCTSLGGRLSFCACGSKKAITIQSVFIPTNATVTLILDPQNTIEEIGPGAEDNNTLSVPGPKVAQVPVLTQSGLILLVGTLLLAAAWQIARRRS
jgi:hypothetical protein